MAYLFYLDGVLLPVTPSTLQLKIGNNNKTLNLVNGEEINILKSAGLTEVEFVSLLPNERYNFANMQEGYKKASEYLAKLEELKLSLKPFQFIVTRDDFTGGALFAINLKVGLEDYKIEESADNGIDISVTIKLKQWKAYGTKVCEITMENNKTIISVQETRETTNAPTPKSDMSYTVQSGDTLWALAKKYYGDGSKYTVIANANKETVSNPNRLSVGQVLTIPAI